jgi:hypothetical protein
MDRGWFILTRRLYSHDSPLFRGGQGTPYLTYPTHPLSMVYRINCRTTTSLVLLHPLYTAPCLIISSLRPTFYNPRGYISQIFNFL